LEAFVAHGGKLAVTGEGPQGLPAKGVSRFAECPGKRYISALEKDFAAASPESEKEFLASLSYDAPVVVDASPWLATQIAKVDGKTHVFFANFKGLRGGENPVQTPEAGAKITVGSGGKAYFLPFMGQAQELKGAQQNGKTVFVLPEIQRGAVVWVEAK
jgi:hypothetical protein